MKLVEVDYNPFDPKTSQASRLVPVNRDPFASPTGGVVGDVVQEAALGGSGAAWSAAEGAAGFVEEGARAPKTRNIGQELRELGRSPTSEIRFLQNQLSKPLGREFSEYERTQAYQHNQEFFKELGFDSLHDFNGARPIQAEAAMRMLYERRLKGAASDPERQRIHREVTEANPTQGMVEVAGAFRETAGEFKEYNEQYYTDRIDSEFHQSMTGKVVNGIGQLGFYIPAGMTGAGGIGAMGASSYQEAVDDYFDAMGIDKTKATEDQRRAAATVGITYAMPAMALERAGLGPVLSRVFKGSAGKLTMREAIKRLGLASAEGFLAEGTTEASQQILLNTISKLSEYDPDREITEGALESFIVGGLVGQVGTVSTQTVNEVQQLAEHRLTKGNNDNTLNERQGTDDSNPDAGKTESESSGSTDGTTNASGEKTVVNNGPTGRAGDSNTGEELNSNHEAQDTGSAKAESDPQTDSSSTNDSQTDTLESLMELGKPELVERAKSMGMKVGGLKKETIVKRILDSGDEARRAKEDAMNGYDSSLPTPRVTNQGKKAHFTPRPSTHGLKNRDGKLAEAIGGKWSGGKYVMSKTQGEVLSRALEENWNAEMTVAEGVANRGKLIDRDGNKLTYPEAKKVLLNNPKPASEASESDSDVHYGSSAFGTASAFPNNTPDWVKKGGETREGRNLLVKFSKDRDGAKVGPGDVVSYLNKLIRVQMRRSTSQTSKKHPANYRQRGHLAMTRDESGELNYHEAGHGLEYLIRSKEDKFFKAHKSELMGLVTRHGSRASAKNTHEGIAEWLRLRVVNPSSVESMAVTQAIDSMLEKNFPGIAQGIRDATRLQAAQFSRSRTAQWRSANLAPKSSAITSSDFLTGKIPAWFSEAAPLRTIERRLFRVVRRNAQIEGRSREEALDLARQASKPGQTLQAIYNSILGITSDVRQALEGTEAGRKGIRIKPRGGDYITVTDKTFREIVDNVGAKHWKLFEEAGWARTVLERLKHGQRDYPGREAGISTQDLREIVSDAEQAMGKTEFNERYKDVERWFNDLLAVEFLGGLKSQDEMLKISLAYRDYWPLPRIMEDRGITGGPTARADIESSIKSAHGSALPIQNLVDVAEDRARAAFRAFYWNDLANVLVGKMSELSKDKDLPFDARAAAGRIAVPLRMKTTVAATISEEEVNKLIVTAIREQRAADEGVDVSEIEFNEDDLVVSMGPQQLWRPTRPNDVQVLGYLENGQRKFVQLNSPELFQLFMGRRTLGSDSNLKEVYRVVSHYSKLFQQAITESLPFAVRNPPRDVFSSMIFGKDKFGWIPGAVQFRGMVEKFQKKHPQIQDDGLLLSRLEPSHSELVRELTQSPIVKFFSDNLYRSHHPDPRIRGFLNFVVNVPSVMLYKPIEVLNVITGGRALARLGETVTREGAAAQAKDSGATDSEAKLRYWQSAGQFNERGNWFVSGVSGLIPFANPMVQSVRQQAELLSHPDPAVRNQAWLKMPWITAQFTAAAIVTYLMMDDDDRAEEKERSLGLRMSSYGVGPFRLSFPYGLEGAAASMAYNAVMDDLLERDPGDDTKRRKMLIERVVSYGDLLDLNNLKGPFMAALGEAEANYNPFYESEIVPPWLATLPNQEQVRDDTPRLYREMGRMFDLSPIKIEYVVREGIARQADEVIQVIDRIEQGKPISTQKAEWPIVGQLFYKDPIGWSSASVQSVDEIDNQLESIERRLDSAGVRIAALDSGVPTDELSKDARQLRVQLDQLSHLAEAENDIASLGRRKRKLVKARERSDISPVQIAQLDDQIKQLESMQVVVAQRALLGDQDYRQRIREMMDEMNDIERGL
ncbi:LPD38 domain-containing protein [Cerasicoccus frondis]|uniref:LPD38 domain-containing protein n=1 Tax=Cerasicoccus frondis TaxID=490090 RepID=UPI0028528251|nr:LPD38 domain-containing protein [Cerasicoccus frondis]